MWYACKARRRQLRNSMVHGMLLLALEASRLLWARLQAEEKG